jgi:hypothetical protein
MVEPLREMLGQYDFIIRGFRERSGMKVAALTCDILPAEIVSCQGLVPLRLPSFISGCCVAEGVPALGSLAGTYDCLAVPDGCAGRNAIMSPGVPVRGFAYPSGWGEAARRGMEAALEKLLRDEGLPGLAALDRGRLRAATIEYNAYRRLARGIATVRRDKPDCLSCADLSVALEAAVVFPPSVAAPHLAALLDALNRAESAGVPGLVPCLVHASYTGEAALFDAIEDAGCLVAEDDTCGGRRELDMSYNHEAPDLVGEILDAFSYRPRCPSVRPLAERVELFYSQLKNHGIEAVIVVEDLCCPARKRDIEALRMRLMRAGVDPLVVTSADAAEKVREYVKFAG